MKKSNKKHNYFEYMKNLAKKAIDSYAYSMNMNAKYCPDNAYFIDYTSYM